MKEVHVVTGFLEHDGKVALFRRSPQVSTYRGRFAGISGSMESGESPAQRMRKELVEETGLESEVVLLAEGRPVPVEDPDLNVRFIVHPFLMHTMKPRIELNFEHEAHLWVEPSAIEQMETVPMLGEVLDEVASVAALHNAMNRLKEEIASDRTSGALGLASKATNILALSQLTRRFHKTSGKQSFQDLALEVANLRGGMESIRNAAARGVLAAEQESEVSLSDRLFALADSYRDQKNQAAIHAARRLKEMGTATVFSLSWSSSVMETLRNLGSGVSVNLVESSPGGEGARAAEALVKEGFRVTLYPDSAMHVAMRDCQAVLLGSDAILDNGDFVNKTGSAIAARLCECLSIPLVVVTESVKLCPTRRWNRESAPWHPVGTQSPNLLVWSEPFEEVKGDLVTTYVTDSGVLDRQGIIDGCLRFRGELDALGILEAFFGEEVD